MRLAFALLCAGTGMRQPFHATRSALALFTLLCAGYIGAHSYSQKHRASEKAVLRAILDSSFADIPPDTTAGAAVDRYVVMRYVRQGWGGQGPGNGGPPGASELMLVDHFESVDDQGIGHGAEWLADSLPDVPRDLIRDFNRVATDQSRIEPFKLGRSKLHLLADSTLSHFFGRYKPGWEGFRRAFPKGGPIVSVSRVGISHDGHWAMVYVGSQGDWLAGAGYLYVMYNDAGIWRIRSSKMLWIS